jgi:hypothetical protein
MMAKSQSDDISRWYRRISLDDGEQILDSDRCYRLVIPAMPASGMLVLTDSRLIWTPSIVWPLAATTVIERSTVKTLDRYVAGFLSLRAPSGWRVHTSEGDFTFMFGLLSNGKRKEQWLAQIKLWANI